MSLPQKAYDLLNAADEARVKVEEATTALKSATETLAIAQTEVDHDKGTVAEANQTLTAATNEAIGYLKQYFSGTLPPVPMERHRNAPQPVPQRRPTGATP